MLQMRACIRNYSLLILKVGEACNQDSAEKIIWEHGRRMHALRAQGLLSIVCQVSDGTEVEGIGIFNASVEEVKNIMNEDPGVKAGIFVYEIHPCRGFPGDRLPK
ncbi:MAG: hypothetical protein JO031_05940 [Ktedonobacteraceae bacterium]|nr:hypothetical protein [Ktedonobacteraceae bacterium]